MSEFGNKIKAFLDPKLSMVAASEQIGVDRCTLIRLASGTKTSCSPKTLEKIVFGLTRNPGERAEILAAYLRDNLTGPMEKLVLISPVHSSSRVQDRVDPSSEITDSLRKLPSLSVKALQKIIARLPRSRKLRRMIVDLGDVTDSLQLEK